MEFRVKRIAVLVAVLACSSFGQTREDKEMLVEKVGPLVEKLELYKKNTVINRRRDAGWTVVNGKDIFVDCSIVARYLFHAKTIAR